MGCQASCWQEGTQRGILVRLCFSVDYRFLGAPIFSVIRLILPVGPLSTSFLRYKVIPVPVSSVFWGRPEDGGK